MDQLVIISLTPCQPDWWAKFTGDDKASWYVPVAAWALCSWDKNLNSKAILPCLPGECGVEPTDQDCELLYMPGAKMHRSGEPGCFQWMLSSMSVR